MSIKYHTHLYIFDKLIFLKYRIHRSLCRNVLTDNGLLDISCRHALLAGISVLAAISNGRVCAVAVG
jgi:hypothetical protein